MTDHTLFDKYGGFSQISKIVLSFYDSLLDSEQVGPFFDDIDMARMVDHQTKFIASLLGGPASYSDSQIRQFHARLDIENSHFDELKKILAATLEAHSFDAEDVVTVLDAFEKRRELVVA